MVVHKTQRLFLETWDLKDFDAFACIARDPQVMRFIGEGDPWPDSRIGWFMGMQSVLHQTLGFCNWKLSDRASGELIGFCGLAPLQQINEIEIGWWLKPAYWKKGLAFEAAECVVAAAREDLGVGRIVARAYRENTNSIKIMDRLGMVFDRVLETNSHGEIVLYSIDNSRGNN